MALSSISAVFAQTAPPPAAPPAPAAVRGLPAGIPAATASDPNKVVLTIGETRLTAAQYDALIDAVPTQYQSFARGAGKRQFAENIVQLMLLSQEAEKEKLADQPKVASALAFARQNLLAQTMFENLQKDAKVDDTLVQLYYDAHKNEYESLRAKHILVRVKGAPMPGAEGKPELTDEQALAKAQDVRKRLLAGEDFAAAAKADSDDTGSAAQGGELGEFHRGMMVPPFEEAAFALKVGDVSEPVKTPFGYHIIVVEEHKTKTLAEVRPDIEKALRPEMARRAVQAMRDKANVQLDDSFFGPMPPPQSAIPNPHVGATLPSAAPPAAK